MVEKLDEAEIRRRVLTAIDFQLPVTPRCPKHHTELNSKTGRNPYYLCLQCEEVKRVTTRDVKLTGFKISELDFQKMIKGDANHAFVYSENSNTEFPCIDITVTVHVQEPRKEISPIELEKLMDEWLTVPAHGKDDNVFKFLKRKLFPEWTL